MFNFSSIPLLSQKIKVLPLPPSNPTNLVASLTVISFNETASLTWNDTSYNEDGFQISRSYNSGPWTWIATVGPSTTSYYDYSISTGSFSYVVGAFNSIGTNYSNVTTLTVFQNGDSFSGYDTGSILNEF